MAQEQGPERFVPALVEWGGPRGLVWHLPRGPPLQVAHWSSSTTRIVVVYVKAKLYHRCHHVTCALASACTQLPQILSIQFCHPQLHVYSNIQITRDHHVIQ